MFWRKKRALAIQLPIDIVEPLQPAISQFEKVRQAADELASSLRSYSDATYQASQSIPDAELVEARAKVEMARKIVSEGRMAYALGRCIPDHVKHWPSWITRDDFKAWVHFNAIDIDARQHEELDGSRAVKVATINFGFNEAFYRLVLRDRGMSYVPDTAEKDGEIELWFNDVIVAKFELFENYADEYSQWQYRDVLALRVGPWMKDMIDIASQIETGQRKWLEDFQDRRTLEAASNIEI